jgi:hypothetical protein
MELHTAIDKNYVPQVGDVLSNNKHSCITIETVYDLDRSSYRVNRNYNDQLAKYEVLQKIIQRKEIIWAQHKLDFQLFPITTPAHRGADEEQTLEIRKNLTLAMYLFYNDNKQYKRIYCSRYRLGPDKKVRVIIGAKTMVRVNHGLCLEKVGVSQYNTSGQRGCCYWYGKKSMPLGSLVAQKYIYRGNIFTVINDIDGL